MTARNRIERRGARPESRNARATSRVVAIPPALSSAPLLMDPVDRRGDPHVVQVGRQDDDFVLQLGVRPGQQAGDVGAAGGPGLGADRGVQPVGQGEARRLAPGLFGRRHGVGIGSAGAGEQLVRAGHAQRRQHRRARRRIEGRAVGARPGHRPGLGGASHLGERTPGLVAGAIGQHQAYGAVRLGGEALGAHAGVIGPLLGLEAGRRALEDHDDLPLHVQTPIVVAAALGRHDAVAGEDQRRVQLQLGRAQWAAGDHVLARDQNRFRASSVQEGEAPVVRLAHGQQRGVLEPGGLALTDVARRREAELGELARHIGRGDVVAARAGLAPLQQVRGQELDVGAHRGGGSVEVRRDLAGCA